MPFHFGDLGRGDFGGMTQEDFTPAAYLDVLLLEDGVNSLLLESGDFILLEG